jgi:microcystin degradation protein MlrC
MVSQSLLDVEGEMLRRMRHLVGPEVLIAGVTDLHANFSPPDGAKR